MRWKIETPIRQTRSSQPNVRSIRERRKDSSADAATKGLSPDRIREMYAATKIAHRPLDLSTESEEEEKYMQQPKGGAHAS